MRSRQALQIGLAQSLAIVPGVSRSGASIVGGLLTGLPRVEATAFSFYLGLPLMAVATAYKLYKHSDGIAKVSGGNSALIVGTLVSFVAGLASVSWLLKYISNHSFRLFAVYRIAAGAFILMLVAIGFFG